jgi:serine/threonine-protein kinase RsbW
MPPAAADAYSTLPETLGFSPRWRRAYLNSARDLPALLEAVIDLMTEHGYPAKDLFATRLALEEAVVNAIKHGHKNDPARQVGVRFRVTAERVLAEVEDQGPGFDPFQVPDPLAVENLECPSGRGLLLMRKYMTWVRFNERGNCVTLCKCPSEPLAPMI